MERRKIIKKREEGFNSIYYESLKPSVFGENGDWERNGRKYDLRGIENLLKGKNFEFIVESEVQKDLDECRERQAERIKEYSSNKGLEKKTESKTI